MDKIRIGDLQFGKAERDAIQRVVDSGRISEWREVRAFEEEFADYLGAKHCVTVSSGTAALMVGLKSLEYLGRVKAGAGVLIPAITFIATANAVTLCGMKPIFADVDPDTFTMMPDYAFCSDADVVLPVHLFGFSAEMTGIKHYCARSYPEPILCEDACEAHGVTFGSKKAGTIGTWGAFSFYIAHTVQAGEFGALVTDDADIALVARRVKAHGRVCACKTCTRNTTGCHMLKDGDPRFKSLYPGYNFKAMEWSAAIARCQLAKIDDNIARRRHNAQMLTERLQDGQLDLQLPNFRSCDVPMVYPIVLAHGSRDDLIVRLEQNGVEARPAFGCIPTQQPAYAAYKSEYDLPFSNWIGEQGFYVGCHQYLTDEHIKRMAEVILESVQK